MRKECPKCRASIGWSERLRMSRILRRRASAPCPGCGTPLRYSATQYLSHVAALGLIASSLVLWAYDAVWLAWVNLPLSILLLAGVLATRLEAAPS